jgi:hypothetical protein
MQMQCRLQTRELAASNSSDASHFITLRSQPIIVRITLVS